MTSNITPSIHKQTNPQNLNQKQVGSEEKSNHKKLDSQVSKSALPLIDQINQISSNLAAKQGLVKLAKKPANIQKVDLKSPRGVLRQDDSNASKSALPLIHQNPQIASNKAENQGLVKTTEKPARIQNGNLMSPRGTQRRDDSEANKSATPRIHQKNQISSNEARATSTRVQNGNLKSPRGALRRNDSNASKSALPSIHQNPQIASNKARATSTRVQDVNLMSPPGTQQEHDLHISPGAQQELDSNSSPTTYQEHDSSSSPIRHIQDSKNVGNEMAALLIKNVEDNPK